jgi:anti-sigma factor ChrR (cupin superfamily)
VHAPFSQQGCVILVKLHQFQPDDTARLAIETDKAEWQVLQPGLEVLLLHRHGTEQVAMVRQSAQVAGIEHPHPGGEEIYVMRGTLKDDDGVYPAGTWLRRPPGSRHCPVATQDALLWVKSGHLG